jgi:hypothetical protein
MRWHLAMGRFLVGLILIVVLGGCTSGATPSPSGLQALPSLPSAAAASPTPAPTPATGSVDVGDQAAASAGASFLATATGVLPPSSGGSSADWLPGEPNPALTPGALNPAVTQATIHSTVCVSGWTATIRPPESFTYALKVKQIVQYAYTNTSTSAYEEDHLI